MIFRMAPKRGKRQLTEALILEVQSYPSIWDKGSSQHKDFVINHNAWRNIFLNMKSSFTAEDLEANQLNSEEDIKNHWRNLRDTFVRKIREMKGKSGAGTEDLKGKKEWPFYKMLLFLVQSDKYSFGEFGATSYIEGAEEDDDNQVPML